MVPPGIRGGRPRLRGDAVLKPRTPPPSKKSVLFVCIGNSCRSQMAEAFARAYGSDIMEVHSAGLSPAAIIAPLTKQTLAERNLSIHNQFPKPLNLAQRDSFDLVINMSGLRVPISNAHIVDWPVQDPIGQSEEVYRTVAAQIEGLVMRLILDLRAGRTG